MTTVADIITKVRQRTEMVSSLYVTDPELVGWISDSLAELDGILISTYEDFKVTVSATLTISSPTDGTNYVSMPAGFLKLRRLDRLEGGEWRRLDPIALLENSSAPRGLTREPLGFFLVGSTAYIEPWSCSAGSYRAWYVPAFTVLTATNNSLATYMDVQAWHEYAVADCCAKITEKQGMDSSQFMGRKMAAQARIINDAQPRQAGAPKRATDTRGRRARGEEYW